MRAKHIISEIVPSLRTSDTGIRALNWMEIFRVSHLPIINNKEFLGLISDTDIYDLNKAEEPIGNHTLSLIRPYVFMEQHIFEILEIISRLKLTVVPVLDNNKEYLGLITLMDVVKTFANYSAISNPGSILVLELNSNDLILSQIVQIVESNDCKILSLFVSDDSLSTKLNVTLKLNRNDISSVVQTFNRYNYTIKDSFLEENEMDELYNSRYESFMRFLNV